ncbi:(deoxy)nucleoside triphosphate pyrophosphohydrolase [Nocardioides montaniterrae]
MSEPIQVVGAVIVRDGLILCARRGPGGETGGLWEFPGGKLEPGETAQQALAREILEELGCAVAVGEHLTTTTHAYAGATVVLSTYHCTLGDGAPHATEHDELRWLAPADLGEVAWAPADVPAVELLHSAAGDAGSQ